MRVYVIIAMMILAGCGTRNYKEFDFSNISENQGIIIGKIDIQYNHRPFDSTGCQFCAGLACQSLLDDGYVFMPVEKGPLTQGRLSCSNPDFCCDYLSFTVESFEVGSDAIYFGNLIFTVYDPSHNIDTATVSTTRTFSLIKEAPEDYYIDDFGKAAIRDFASWATTFDVDIPSSQRTRYTAYFDVSVKDGMSDVLEAFHTQVKNKDVKVEKNILNIKLEIEEAAVYR